MATPPNDLLPEPHVAIYVAQRMGQQWVWLVSHGRSPANVVLRCRARQFDLTDIVVIPHDIWIHHGHGAALETWLEGHTHMGISEEQALDMTGDDHKDACVTWDQE
jgi:hypothetical protein